MKITNTELLTRMIRRSGITRGEMSKRMYICTATLRKYINHPEKMNGLKRRQMAKILLIDIAIMDSIVNTKKFDLNNSQAIIQTIKTKQTHGNQTGELDSH